MLKALISNVTIVICQYCDGLSDEKKNLIGRPDASSDFFLNRLDCYQLGTDGLRKGSFFLSEWHKIPRQEKNIPSNKISTDDLT